MGYFGAILKKSRDESVPARMRFMLRDLMDLKEVRFHVLACR